MRPAAIGIGAQKCMTSWVHALAAAHPAISASSPKEVDFFSYHFDRGYRWYERHFGSRTAGHDGRWADIQTADQSASAQPIARGRTSALEPSRTRAPVGFESSPSYFHDPRAPARAAAYAPDLRIVVLLRDPVERAYSNHLHEVIKGHIPPQSFADGLANNPAYIEQGLYATHLGAWLDHFPREQVLCLIAEEIQRDLPAAAARVYDFLGVDPGYRSGVLTEKRNDSDRARLPWLRTALRVGGDAARRVGLEEALIQVKRAPGIARVLLANSVVVREEVPPPTEADRARLKDRFAAEVEALPALIGRSALPWPNFPAMASA